MALGFSPIQNHILSKLKNADRMRYSELQPKSIPNDLFNYHLQFLVKKEYVARRDEGYALAPKGIKHVADPDTFDANFNIASLFKVNVITIVSRKGKKGLEILNQRRQSHPSYGKIGVPGGIVRKGESMLDAAKRKLKVETGLEAGFKLLGMERRMMYKKNQLFSDILFPIAYSDAPHGELEKTTEFGENFWTPIDKAIKNESVEFDSIVSIVKVLKAIKSKRLSKLPFFYEESVQAEA